MPSGVYKRTPEHNANNSAAQKIASNRPEVKEANRAAHMGRRSWNKDLTKETDSRIATGAEKMLGDNNPSKRPEVRVVMSEKKQGCVPWNKDLTKEIDFRVAQHKDRSYIGAHGYPLSFYDIVEEIRDRDGRMCTSCGKLEKDNKKKLSVHHIDENRLNSDPENLITLCMSCHNKLHPDRSEFKC